MNADKTITEFVNPFAVQPSSYFDDTMDLVGPMSKTNMLDSEDVYESGLSATEMLYTARGTQSMGVTNTLADAYDLDPSLLDNSFRVLEKRYDLYQDRNYYKRASFIYNDSPIPEFLQDN